MDNDWLWTLWCWVIGPLLIINLTVFVHELGHYLAARRAGIGILFFSIGFGPTICAWNVGHTWFQIALLPFGGYVEPLTKAIADHHKTEPKPKPGINVRAWARFLAWRESARNWYENPNHWLENTSHWKMRWFALAGPLANLAFAALAYWCADGRLVPIREDAIAVVKSVVANSEAARHDIHAGDVLFVQQPETTTYLAPGSPESCGSYGQTLEEIGRTLTASRFRKPLIYVFVQRGGTGRPIFGLETVNATLPVSRLDYQRCGQAAVVGRFGIILESPRILRFERIDLGATAQNVITAPSKPTSDEIEKPPLWWAQSVLTLPRTFAEQLNEGWHGFLFALCFFNFNLFVFNLIPLGMLDGRKVLFGKRQEHWLENILVFGLIALFVLTDAYSLVMDWWR